MLSSLELREHKLPETYISLYISVLLKAKKQIYKGTHSSEKNLGYS